MRRISLRGMRNKKDEGDGEDGEDGEVQLTTDKKPIAFNISDYFCNCSTKNYHDKSDRYSENGDRD